MLLYCIALCVIQDERHVTVVVTPAQVPVTNGSRASTNAVNVHISASAANQIPR